MTRIAVLATGGTIASRRLGAGAVATDSATSLVGHTDEPESDIVVEPHDVLKGNSYNFHMGDLALIARAVSEQMARPEIDGVVVTHGTDTMEETAFLTDLVSDDARPVVFTGAQRSADARYPDGPVNLRDAIEVAAHPDARGHGVLACFAQTVFAARGLSKVHTIADNPFAARAGRTLGSVDGHDVRLSPPAPRLSALPLPGPGFDEVDIAVVCNYPGSSAAPLQDALDRGARGIVVIGTGCGNTRTEFIPVIEQASANNVVVCLGSRAAAGEIIPLYGGGGGADAVAAGAVPLGVLPWSQARVLLALLLDRYTPERAREILHEQISFTTQMES